MTCDVLQAADGRRLIRDPLMHLLTQPSREQQQQQQQLPSGAPQSPTRPRSCIQTTVNKKLTGMVATNTAAIDECLMSLDPSPTAATVGANVIHATSIACVRAAAKACHEQVAHRTFTFISKP